MPAEVDVVGGATNTKLFGIWQRTNVCASNGRVTSVAVTGANSIEFGGFMITLSGITTNTYNAGYEGRGVASVVGHWGVVLFGSPVGTSKTICSKIYLNANGYNYRLTSECWA